MRPFFLSNKTPNTQSLSLSLSLFLTHTHTHTIHLSLDPQQWPNTGS